MSAYNVPSLPLLTFTALKQDETAGHSGHLGGGQAMTWELVFNHLHSFLGEVRAMVCTDKELRVNCYIKLGQEF